MRAKEWSHRRRAAEQRKRLRRRERVVERQRLERERRDEEPRRARRVRRLAGPASSVTRIRRRDVLVGGAGAALLASAPSLTGCSSDDEDVKPGTLFFNLSHEDFAAKTYYLTGGGKRYRLTKVSDAPHVLDRARRKNAFLRQVPDQHVTHHIEGTTFAADTVTLTYVSSDLDTTTGTWSMSAVNFVIPPATMGYAYQQARLKTPSGPLPLSPKREMYGIAAAQTEQDLRDELVLIDTNSAAAAILGAAPDVCSLDPNSAAHIQTNYIANDPDVKTLARALGRTQYGPATPEATAGKTNAVGWGTLTPVIDDSTGLPFKNVKGTHAGRIQYQPVFHPDIVAFASGAVASLSSQVKDDPALGADITGLIPKPTDPPNAALTGTMWARHDGASVVDQSPGATATLGDAVSMTLKQSGPQNGLQVSATLSGSATTPTVALTMDNWYSRFLGVWLQFLDTSGNPITLTTIPEYTAGTIISGHVNDSDTATEMFIAALGPVFTILAIPTWPGYITPSFTVPASAHAVRTLASGIGSGSNNYSDTLIYGEVLTGIVNYGVTALMCAAGAAATFSVIMKTLVVPVCTPLAIELGTLLQAAVSGNGIYTPGFWKAQGLGLAKYICTVIAGGAVSALVTRLAAGIVAATGEAAAEDAIPIAGWIMLGISLAVGVANLIETSVEVALSPWTYVNDLVFTHELDVTINPDPDDGAFPAGADHCVVTAMLDNGTPYVQTLPLPTPKPSSLSVQFTSFPLGGMVNVSVGFYQSDGASGVAQGILLGKGTTGLIANDTGAAPTITIQEVRFPISSATTYQHTQKSALDASGNHVWDTAAPPPVATVLCGTAGTICNYQGITVRQGTATQQGYVGYGWRAQSQDPTKGAACGGGGGTGQFDQIANLNTGVNPQQGYLPGPCGFVNPGVKVSYSLLSHQSANFYLDLSDPTALHLRQVTLEPPGYEPPSAANPPTASPSWGVLNFAPNALLLHPAGHFVSINSVNSKLETLPVPAVPMADANAETQLLAQAKSGLGSRPGLMTSPVAAAVAPDGTILVLESGSPTTNPPLPARLQALDIGANPKQFFSAQTVPYFLELTATPNTGGWQYLDMAIEYGGYIYVLSANQGTYRLDIYHPAQSGTAPISTTMGFNAAKLCVDFWRNLYSLNYEVIVAPGGSPPGFTEPSVSLWTPTDSCTGAGCMPS